MLKGATQLLDSDFDADYGDILAECRPDPDETPYNHYLIQVATEKKGRSDEARWRGRK